VVTHSGGPRTLERVGQVTKNELSLSSLHAERSRSSRQGILSALQEAQVHLPARIGGACDDSEDNDIDDDENQEDDEDADAPSPLRVRH
jgi:hypothetical protein